MKSSMKKSVSRDLIHVGLIFQGYLGGDDFTMIGLRCRDDCGIGVRRNETGGERREEIEFESCCGALSVVVGSIEAMAN